MMRSWPGYLGPVLVLACGPRGSSSTPAPIPVTESAHYRRLVVEHGKDNVLVGSVPYDANRIWVSSAADEYPGLGATTELIERLTPRLEAFGNVAGPDSMWVVSTWGEHGWCNELALVFEPEHARGHVDTIVTALDTIQRFLGEPANRAFRIGVFDDGVCGTGTPWTCKNDLWSTCTLVIYPDAIFLGGRRVAHARELAAELPAWFERVALRKGAQD